MRNYPDPDGTEPPPYGGPGGDPGTGSPAPQPSDPAAPPPPCH